MYAADGHNPWIGQARAARRRWPGWAAALAAAAFSATVLLVFRTWGGTLQAWLLVRFGGLSGDWPQTATYGVLQGLIFGCFLLAALTLMAVEGRSPWIAGLGRGRALAWGLLIGAGGFGAAVGVAALAGAISPGPLTGSPLAPALFGLALVAIQSLSEEAFFRAWLQPLLSVAWGGRAGLIVAAAIFAGLHVIAGAQSALAVANLFLGGVLFGLLAVRFGNLFAAAGAHFAWNWAESGVLGLTDSPTGSLAHLGFRGAVLWNGGPDTMNGSLAMTLVLAVLVALAAWRRGRS